MTYTINDVEVNEKEFYNELGLAASRGAKMGIADKDLREKIATHLLSHDDIRLTIRDKVFNIKE